jgi:nifR3 family TIM-barrel protein
MQETFLPKCTEDFQQPFYIGNVSVPGPLVLGPMAGVTDSVFRNICTRMGANMTVTEMISAKGLKYNNPNTYTLMDTSADAHPVALQLFGDDPEILAEQAKRIEHLPFDILDINMGCPMPKIVNNGEGSALMKNPLLISKIVDTLTKTIGKPVTVKLRRGFAIDEETVCECAVAAYESGAAAITVHGRYREQYYSGQADWECIAKVKNCVKIPVIGNGDVKEPEDALRMMRITGCDAVMIARAARGNPWIFQRTQSLIHDGARIPKPNFGEIRTVLLEHARAMAAIDQRGLVSFRKHLGWYLSGLHGAARLRASMDSINTIEDIKRLLDEKLLT